MNLNFLLKVKIRDGLFKAHNTSGSPAFPIITAGNVFIPSLDTLIFLHRFLNYNKRRKILIEIFSIINLLSDYINFRDRPIKLKVPFFHINPKYMRITGKFLQL